MTLGANGATRHTLVVVVVAVGALNWGMGWIGAEKAYWANIALLSTRRRVLGRTTGNCGGPNWLVGRASA